METSNSRISRGVTAAMQNQDSCRVFVKEEAQPEDILNCVAAPNIANITIIAHAAGSNQSVALTWPIRLNREERAIVAQPLLANLRARRQALEARPGFDRHETTSEYFDVLRIEQEIKSLEDQTLPLYQWGTLYDRFFYRLAIILAVRSRPLTKISFVACEQSRMRQRYPSLALVESRTQIQFAPNSTFASWVFGGEKAGLDLAWIRESLE